MIFRQLMRAKIHRLTITDARLDYEGSITVDQDLLDLAGILDGEKVQIVNVNNGSRLETYVMKGGRKSGTVCLNGAAARLGARGDIIILITYALVSEDEIKSFRPTVVLVGPNNRARKTLRSGKGAGR